MTFRKAWIAGAAGLMLSSSIVQAQAPGPAAAAGAPPSAAFGPAGVGPAGAGAAAPAAAAPRTIWSFFGLSASNLQACREKLCTCQVGQMLNSLLAGPVGAISGGFICPLCPPAPTPAQLAALEKMQPGGAEATAAKIKQSEADAKARVAAVEYLGTVDCTHWKEASKALINSLRADPNECVRFAAARVLNSGCCCNKDTIEALRISVAGEDKDGNPPENSCRVKAAAFSALQNCLMRVAEVLPEEVPTPKPPVRERERGPVPEPLPGAKPLGRERSTMNEADSTHLAASYTTSVPSSPRFEQEPQPKTYGQTVNEARQTLREVARGPKQSSTLAPGKRSVLNAFIKARQDVKSKSTGTPDTASAPSDPGVVPSSFAPGADPAVGSAPATPAAEAATSSREDNPKGASSADSSTESKRGLVGLLIKSWNHHSDQ
jgi:hypothetical protein